MPAYVGGKDSNMQAWAGKKTDPTRDMIEAALAHVV
jgi:hypothetical protein